MKSYVIINKELVYNDIYNKSAQQIVSNLIICHGITKLSLTNNILVQLNDIPNNLTVLIIYKDVPYNLDDLPNSITHLYLLLYTKTLDCLCEGILTLKTGDKFNYPIVYLPSTLIELILGYEFNHPVDKLPQNLKILELGCKFNHPIDALPQTLQRLILGEHFNQSLDVLIDSITYLYIIVSPI